MVLCCLSSVAEVDDGAALGSEEDVAEEDVSCDCVSFGSLVEVSFSTEVSMDVAFVVLLLSSAAVVSVALASLVVAVVAFSSVADVDHAQVHDVALGSSLVVVFQAVVLLLIASVVEALVLLGISVVVLVARAWSEHAETKRRSRNVTRGNRRARRGIVILFFSKVSVV
jgi:hypothetical protein